MFAKNLGAIVLIKTPVIYISGVSDSFEKSINRLEAHNRMGSWNHDIWGYQIVFYAFYIVIHIM